MPTEDQRCCPRFDPEPWNEKTVTWHDKHFVKDHVTSLFHVPLNYGAVMARVEAAIRTAGAQLEAPVMLTDELSPWGADVYVEASRNVPGATMSSLSGTFLCKVFEGPFSQMGTWMDEMTAWLSKQGQRTGQRYVSYTTCPRCAKKYGKNYVVLLAQVA